MVGIYRKVTQLTDGSEVYDIRMVSEEKRRMSFPANDARHAEQIKQKVIEMLDVAGVEYIDCGETR
jgi:hypothetical protein